MNTALLRGVELGVVCGGRAGTLLCGARPSGWLLAERCRWIDADEQKAAASTWRRRSAGGVHSPRSITPSSLASQP